MNDIVKFHIKHGYYVKVEALPNLMGCSAIFPANVLYERDVIEKTYVLNIDPVSIDIYTLEWGKPIVSKNVLAYKTNIRLLVLQDLMLYAYSMGLSKDLIVIQDGKTLFELLALDNTKEELTLETELCKSFRKMLAGDIDATSNVEGYQQVLTCFEERGL